MTWMDLTFIIPTRIEMDKSGWGCLIQGVVFVGIIVLSLVLLLVKVAERGTP